ncbi:MAG: 4,5-DOPA dioxygenase extradiol [Alphaproteobacteria bacterium]
MTMPAVFLGHGSPMNAIEDNDWRRAWGVLGSALPRPRAVLCVSAHWETRGIGLTADSRPETIHDFGGFPQPLFDVQYPAPGDSWLVERVQTLLRPAQAHAVKGRGFDHGMWGVLRPMYPDADVPVVQLSLDMSQTPQGHFELGKRLRPLRAEGVLIVGSGNIVHNLMLRGRYPEPADWAVRFDAAIRQAIEGGAYDQVIDYPGRGQDAMLSVPTPEHYLPLLYVLGAATAKDRLRFFSTDVFSTMSMTSVVFEPGEGAT